MKKYDFISVILVYRNFDDLEECLISTQEKIHDCRCIVVNAYYDDESMKTIREIAEKYDCDFLNIENKGYSYGNNYGISYAREHYDYKYIIVSNPDILINSFDTGLLDKGDIFAPKITAKTGNRQNPMNISRWKWTEWLIYQGLKKGKKSLLYSGIGVNKVRRVLGVFLHEHSGKRWKQIYMAHGSFVILSKKTVDTLYPVYDEEMFLFAEENVLADKAQRAGLKIIYSDAIDILHKEDGSMKFIGQTVSKELVKSNIYYYENYVLRKK